MGQAKHTAGPWKAYESSERSPYPAGVPVEVGTAAGKGAAAGSICDIVAQGPDGRYDPETTAANARLIAAAPLLLEGCRKALTCASIPDYVRDVIREAVRAAESE